MSREFDTETTRVIDRTAPRALFAELVAAALASTRMAPSPLAVAYVIDLLETRLSPLPADAAGDATFAEGLLRARQKSGIERLNHLRRLGDRALFEAGFFGDSLDRGLVGIGYYGDVGRSAYASVASGLAVQHREPVWPRLYGELAHHFHGFVEVLAEVGDRTRATSPNELSRLYERYLRSGAERDRRRLCRRGLVVAEADSQERWQ